MATRMCCLLLLVFLFCHLVTPKKGKESSKDNAAEKWKKKDVRDYTDADIERLYDQWEEGDEDELEPDELPEWKREPPPVDMSHFNPDSPDDFLKQSKKGRTLMMFATIAGNPTQQETETISQLWHSSLFNANIETQRFVVGNNRVLFMCRDGSKAWEIKDFLVQQDNCESVEIEGKTYQGKGEQPASNDTKEDKKKKTSKERKAASKNDIKNKKVEL